MGKQLGYIHFSTASVLFALAVVGVIGWGIIELILLFFSHIDLSWV